ncbi:hypothetical protein Tco_0624680 [Tanacetum coccineum]|uniref:Uncharacterized protein n=1 Tax=Tanacetum coccineum TaxID=301880 RepID=A0ABQ4WEM6_9ASTR
MPSLSNLSETMSTETKIKNLTAETTDGNSDLNRSLLHDNIVPKPDLALELGKSISLTEAEEEAVAREVHATHARIVSGPDPEPMQEDQTGSNSGKLHVSLAGPNPEHMDDEFLATAYPKVHENLKLITDERVIEENPESHSGSMSSMKNLDDTYNFGDQFLYDKPTEDDQEKSKVIEESDSTIPDPSHQTVTSTPPVNCSLPQMSHLLKPSSLCGMIGAKSCLKYKKMITLLLFLVQLNPQVHTSILKLRSKEASKGRMHQNKVVTRGGETRFDYSIRSPDNVALEESLIADADAMDRSYSQRLKTQENAWIVMMDEDDVMK